MDKSMPDIRHEAGRIVNVAIEDQMRDSFLDYSMSVIVSRALPDARDGLKPVQRRILFAMNEAGLRASTGYRKSASVVGDVLGRYHPHGDSAVYDTMVRLAQPFSMAEPLVDGQGNFGSLDGDPAAAYRYTEARLSRAAEELLRGIDMDTVDFTPTFDDQNREPSVLPARLPNLLLNGSTGIAVGMATNIPPMNLREIAAAVRILCDRPDATDDEVLAPIHGPDFPTGGIVVDDAGGVADFLRTGEGKMVMRGRVHVESLRGGRNALVITEIPYGVMKSTIVERIVDKVRERKLDGIADVRDESDRDGVRVVIEIRRDVSPQKMLDAIYRTTPLQMTFGGKLLALVGRAPRVLTVRQALEVFIAHRLEVVARKARFELQRAEARAHIVEGLLIAINAIDRVVALIRGSRTQDSALKKLRAEFSLSEIQGKAILALRLARLTALDVKTLEQEHRDLLKEISDLRDFLADGARRRRMVRDDMAEMAELYGRDRRTELVTGAAVRTLTKRAAEERVRVYLTESGRVWGRHEGARAKSPEEEGDPVVHTGDALSRDRLVLFTDRGRYFPLEVADLLEGSGRPRNLSSVVQGLERDERVLLVEERENLESGVVIFVTASGQIKATEATEYGAPRAGGVVGCGLADGDRVVRVFRGQAESSQIILATTSGQAIRFAAAEVSVQGRTARGVRGIRLVGKADEVVAAGIAGSEVAVIARSGMSKRILTDQFPVQGRGGAGVRLFRDQAKAGPVVWAATSPFVPSLLVKVGDKWQDLAVGSISGSDRASAGSLPEGLAEGVVEQVVAPVGESGVVR
jgi:DNA gyrase subunit A